MAFTDILNITEVEASQSQKEVTINEAVNALALASNDILVVLVADVASVAITSADPDYNFDRNMVFDLTADTTPPSGAFAVELPATKRLFVVRNTTAQEATIEVDPASDGADGATVAIPAGESKLLYSDGVDVEELSGSGGSGGAVTKTLTIAVSDETTDITTGTGKITFRAPQAMTLTGIRASLGTASTFGAVSVDVNEGGVSILSTVITIDQGEKTSTTAATAAVISDSAIADDAEITIDIDGAGTGAKGLKVTLVYT